MSSPTDPVGYAASYLGGNARRWLMAHWSDKGRSSDWKSFRAELVTAFSTPYEDEQLSRQLVRCKQAGSLRDYVTEFTGLCLRVNSVGELTKTTLFIEGLSDAVVQREVCREHPKSLQEAIRAALTAMQLLEKTASTPGIPTEEERSGVHALQRSLPMNQPRPRLSLSERLRLIREKRCFICKKVGHQAAVCHQNPNASHR